MVVVVVVVIFIVVVVASASEVERDLGPPPPCSFGTLETLYRHIFTSSPIVKSSSLIVRVVATAGLVGSDP